MVQRVHVKNKARYFRCSGHFRGTACAPHVFKHRGFTGLNRSVPLVLNFKIQLLDSIGYSSLPHLPKVLYVHFSKTGSYQFRLYVVIRVVCSVIL
jgi:hypothetical protein